MAYTQITVCLTDGGELTYVLSSYANASAHDIESFAMQTEGIEVVYKDYTNRDVKRTTYIPWSSIKYIERCDNP